MLVRDLITSSLRKIGVIASGETPSASELQDSLAALNLMIGSWSTSTLALNVLSREVFELVPGKQSYTVGLSGDFNTSKVMRLLGAAYGTLIKTPIFGEVVIPEDDPLTPEDESLEIPDPPIIGYKLSSNFEIPMQVINYQAWQGTQLKDTASTIPMYLYAENIGGLDRYHFWPVPTESCAAVIYAKKVLNKFEDADAEIDLPPGYEEALVYNLAIRLADEFGREIKPGVASIARDSLAGIKRMNSPVIIMKSDAVGLTRTGKRFNILSGDFR